MTALVNKLGDALNRIAKIVCQSLPAKVAREFIPGCIPTTSHQIFGSIYRDSVNKQVRVRRAATGFRLALKEIVKLSDQRDPDRQASRALPDGSSHVKVHARATRNRCTDAFERGSSLSESAWALSYQSPLSSGRAKLRPCSRNNPHDIGQSAICITSL